MIHGRCTSFAESAGRKANARLPSLQPERLLAFEPIWARLADHAHLVLRLATASAADGTAADAFTGRDAT
jgi:hypothetical protein